MFHTFVNDILAVLYLTHYIAVWILFYKTVIWLCRNDIETFNLLFVSAYIVSTLYEAERLRIGIATIICLVNWLYILSKLV
jgi:hypothetical protein